MSYKVLQLSPQASTDGIRAKSAIQNYWNAPLEGSQEFGRSPSWIEDESESSSKEEPGISGLALAAAFSASVWAGIALIIVRALG